jgi:hypothetical protein
VRRQATTGKTGRFKLTGFERGDYVLTARRNGYRNASVTSIQGGEDRLVVTMRRRNQPR